MKPFKLYLGGSSQMATLEITNDPGYERVVGMVQQVRTRLLSDATLRKPLLHIFQTVYEDDSAFPQHLIPCTPIIDQVLNVVKIRAIRTSAPCDSDVVDYLTNAFPHVYLEQNGFLENDVLWGETISGRDSADKEEVALNASLIQIWLYTSNPLNPPTTETQIPGVKLLFMVIAVFLHELAHSALVWYGRGSCDSPKLGNIDAEAGDYYETEIFGGISSCEIDKVTMKITQVGIYKGSFFYPIDRWQSAEIVKLKTSRGPGLPLLNQFQLSAAPPPTIDRYRAKAAKLHLQVSGSAVFPISKLEPVSLKSATHFYTTLKGDKKRVMPESQSDFESDNSAPTTLPEFHNLKRPAEAPADSDELHGESKHRKVEP